MKLNKILVAATASALLLSGSMMFTSCTDNFESLNTNRHEVDPSSMPFAAQFIEPLTYCLCSAPEHVSVLDKPEYRSLRRVFYDVSQLRW